MEGIQLVTWRFRVLQPKSRPVTISVFDISPMCKIPVSHSGGASVSGTYWTP